VGGSNSLGKVKMFSQKDGNAASGKTDCRGQCKLEKPRRTRPRKRRALRQGTQLGSKAEILKRGGGENVER